MQKLYQTSGFGMAVFFCVISCDSKVDAVWPEWKLLLALTPCCLMFSRLSFLTALMPERWLVECLKNPDQRRAA